MSTISGQSGAILLLPVLPSRMFVYTDTLHLHLADGELRCHPRTIPRSTVSHASPPPRLPPQQRGASTSATLATTTNPCKGQHEY